MKWSKNFDLTCYYRLDAALRRTDKAHLASLKELAAGYATKSDSMKSGHVYESRKLIKQHIDKLLESGVEATEDAGTMLLEAIFHAGEVVEWNREEFWQDNRWVTEKCVNPVVRSGLKCILTYAGS